MSGGDGSFTSVDIVHRDRNLLGRSQVLCFASERGWGHAHSYTVHQGQDYKETETRSERGACKQELSPPSHSVTKDGESLVRAVAGHVRIGRWTACSKSNLSACGAQAVSPPFPSIPLL